MYVQYIYEYVQIYILYSTLCLKMYALICIICVCVSVLYRTVQCLLIEHLRGTKQRIHFAYLLYVQYIHMASVYYRICDAVLIRNDEIWILTAKYSMLVRMNGRLRSCYFVFLYILYIIYKYIHPKCSYRR